jgi:DegV family protein with EDD domain
MMVAKNKIVSQKVKPNFEQSRKIGLLVDDTCSLPEKTINDFQIEVVKIKLYFPEWDKFPEKNLYQVMEETRAGPKTSAPPPGDYLKAYKKTLEKFEKALVITLSSKLSATYSSAREAKEFMPDPSKIEIFDSLTAASPEGLLSLRAGELIQEGRNLEEILKTLENLRERIKLFAFLKTTYWVEKIGRISSRQVAAFKTLKTLGVQPMLGFKKGKVALTGFNFWTKDTFKALFYQLKYQSKRSGKLRIGINYTDNIELAYQLKEKMEKELAAEIAFISLVPPIIGANSGPGTIIAGCLPV